MRKTLLKLVSVNVYLLPNPRIRRSAYGTVIGCCSHFHSHLHILRREISDLIVEDCYNKPTVGD